VPPWPGQFREDLFYGSTSWHRAAPLSSGERTSGLWPATSSRAWPNASPALTLTDGAIAWLEEQEWRGNVRELENTIERAVVLTDGDVLEPGNFAHTHAPRPRPCRQVVDIVEAAEREAIAVALGEVDGNRRTAAKRLGVSLRTLFYKMSRYGLD